jgi:hypothetical protein
MLNEDIKHLLLNCAESKNWRTQYMSKEWLFINEQLPYRKILNCSSKAHIMHLGEYLGKVKGEWENRMRNLQ